MPGMPIQAMRNIIKNNGHLILEGNESKDELAEALINLRHWHSGSKCHRPTIGTPIQILIPDTAPIYAARSVRARDRDMETGLLLWTDARCALPAL